MVAHDDAHFTGWTQISPKILRAWRDRAQNERTRKARCLYAEYRRNILPAEWFYLPSLEQATRLPWCAEILGRDVKVRVVESDFNIPLTNLASSVQAWIRGKRDQYIAMLPEWYRSLLPPTASMTPTVLTSPFVDDVRQGRAVGELRPFLGPLELAMAVFTLPNSPTILVAKDACHAWKQDVPLEFSEVGSATALYLLWLAGTDPTTITAVQFDALHYSFWCLNCHRANGDSFTGMKLETWRSAVSIFLCRGPREIPSVPAQLIPFLFSRSNMS